MNTSEDELVEWFKKQRPLDSDRFPIGIGDDMAQVNLPGGGTVLITTDMLLSGVHFDLAKARPDQIGYKAMACSLSDCAAMATRPVAAVVGVGLPDQIGLDQLRQIHDGILRAADRYDCPLIGGDMTVWKQKDCLAICVSMLSVPLAGGPVRRSGAVSGDLICVTGWLGGSLSGRHLEFEPRVWEAQRIVELVKVHAMMDISDGLATDLPRLCRASGVGAVIRIKDIPIAKEAACSQDKIVSALSDGEDFELLFTIDQRQYDLLIKAWDGRVPITCIGQVIPGDKVYIQWPDRRLELLRIKGYDHFERSLC